MSTFALNFTYTKQLVWYLLLHAVLLGRISLRCDELLGLCMVGLGAAWCYCMGLLVLHV